MKIFSFAKFTGAGNDFVLLDRQLNPNLEVDMELIRQLCDRRYGIGADGVLIIEDIERMNFSALYYNADGTSGSLCANGARCSIEYARLSNRIKDDVATFKFNGQKYSGKVLSPGFIELKMPAPMLLRYDFKVNLSNNTVNYSFAETGAPHAVIMINELLEDFSNPKSFYTNLNKVPVKELGREIRYSREFAPNGTNVDFIKIEDNKIFMRTYERGVEDETFACGTGAVACAVISHFKNNIKPPIEIFTKMNEKFIVNFDVADRRIKNLVLAGAANLVFYGKITI
ncbi:MAG: diaminopimelate epimerase [bacterium]